MRTSPKLPVSPGESGGHQSSPKPDPPRPTNAAIAMIETLHTVPGAQGRIRTFVPRKEGQIYSLLALTTHPPVQTFGPSRPLSANLEPALRMRGERCSAGNHPIEKQSARENPLARKHHTWKNSLWSAVGKKSVTPPRRAKPYIPEPILPIKPIKCWSWRRDLNPRPSDYKSDALPTELRQQSETTGPRGRIYPSDPFQMSGTILKGTITVICTQPTAYFTIFHTVP